jgi:hypothetical protein
MIEVQVKTITSGTWPLGSKGTVGALTDREWYVFVLLGGFPNVRGPGWYPVTMSRQRRG